MKVRDTLLHLLVQRDMTCLPRCLQHGLRHRPGKGCHGRGQAWGACWTAKLTAPNKVTMRGYCRAGAADHHTTHWNYHLTLEQYGMPNQKECFRKYLQAFATTATKDTVSFGNMASFDRAHKRAQLCGERCWFVSRLRRVVIYAPNSSKTSPSDPHYHVIRNIDRERVL